MIKKPMLAVAAEDLNELKFPLLATPKLDGIRCLKVNGKAVTRKFKPIPNHSIREFIESRCPDGFDGEIICPGKTFNETQSLVMTEEGSPVFTFVVFDYVKEDVKTPYKNRVRDLVSWSFGIDGASDVTSSIVKVLYPEPIENLEQLKSFEQVCIDQGFEGVMVRTPDSPYKNGRSTLREGYLLKIKRFKDSEAVVYGFVEQFENNNELTKDELGHAKRSSHKENLAPANTLGALIVRDLYTQVEFEIGTGFDRATRKQIWDNRNLYLNKIVTYRYQESGMKDKPRFPSFQGFRDPRDM